MSYMSFGKYSLNCLGKQTFVPRLVEKYYIFDGYKFKRAANFAGYLCNHCLRIPE